MVEPFLFSIWDIFSCSFRSWDPTTNLVQSAFLICIVLGIVLLITRIISVS